MLTALEDAAKAQEEAKVAAANASSKETAGDITAADSSNADTSDADNVYKDGTYTGEAQGFGGTIQVQVTLAGDEITDIQVTSAPGEDSAYLSQGEGVISSILSAQSTDVDTISGATFSSTGIINAVVDALGKRKTDEKRQRKVRLIRAAIQLVFFIVAPALFPPRLRELSRSFRRSRQDSR